MFFVDPQDNCWKFH